VEMDISTTRDQSVDTHPGGGAAQLHYSLVSEAMIPWQPLFFCAFRNRLRFSDNT
jgi:hypothetical protein